MKIFNTLTRQKEEFKEIKEGTVTIYACGPTVYNLFHIGNARPFITFDLLRRYFEYRGKKVRFVQNFTDIDDKMINKANEQGITVKELGEKYIAEYYTDAKGLGVRPATIHPRATDCIGDIIALVKELEDKGYAYAVDGDVYFRTKQFKEYGKLSHLPLDELESGARIGVDDRKEDPMDFALWKAQKPGEPAWESPWGMGRPGWHIECSAMANKYLGKTIDIHCGGVDLVFPHHENEIAQSECAHGCNFANYWMHNGHINVDNRKMSKSAGNFFTVRDAAQAYGYEVIRFFMLTSHYRSPINYSAEALEGAGAGLERLYNTRDNLRYEIKNSKTPKLQDGEDVSVFAAYRDKFCEKMDDDLNTADAISVLFDMAKDINIALESPHSVAFLNEVKGIFEELAGVLGILSEEREVKVSDEVLALVEARTKARAEKDWAKADEIRDALSAMGIIVEDTKDGPKILMKK